MKRTLVIFLSAAMLFTLAACTSQSGQETQSPSEQVTSGASDETFELNVNLSFSEGSGKAVKEACDRITEKTNGRVKFNLYYSWSLVTVADAIRSLQGGIVDIIIAPAQEYPSIFVRTGSLMALPMIQLPGMIESTEIFMDLYNEYESMHSEIEGNGMKLWTVSYTAPQNIHCVGTDSIVTPADLKGHKVIAATTELQDLIIANNGAPISVTGPDYYSTLEKGVADSVVQHLNALGAFGVAPELINSSTIFGESGLYMTSVLYLINQDVWNSFPPDIQEIFMDEADTLRVEQTNNDKAMHDSVTAALKEKGVAITELNEEQLKVWSDAFEDIRTEKLEQMKSLGADDIETLYAALMEKIAEY